jgi:C-terminal processing protease CtpA/Prc
LCDALFAAVSIGRRRPTVNVDRLVALCKLWGTVKYFHPYLAYRPIDWDGALVNAIADLSGAQDSAAFGAAVEKMLSTLDHRATCVVPRKGADEDDPLPTTYLTDDHILVITASSYDAGLEVALERMKTVVEEVKSARGVLFDTRAAVMPSLRGALGAVVDWSGIAELVTPTPVVAPGERSRMHVGFAPQQGKASGVYYSAFLVRDGSRFAPGEGVTEKPVVFLINDRSDLPPLALALQGAGKAAIVCEGEVSDTSAVSALRLDVSEGLDAQVRLSELVYEDGSGGLHADAVIAADESGVDAALQAALNVVRQFEIAPRPARPLPAHATARPDEPYADMVYPPLEYRLFAAFRIWNVIHYFFPYKDLMGEDWDAVLREFIPKMETAGDAEAYALTVAEMMARIHDSHAIITSDALNAFFGVAGSPLQARWIEEAPVISRLLDADAARGAGAAVGDVVLAVDGEAAHKRLERFAPYVRASTAQAHQRNLMRHLMAGPDGSIARLTLEGAAGRVKEAALPRSRDYAFEQWLTRPQRDGNVLEMLPGNIGYADLDRLMPEQVDEMFERFEGTRAIIFDMRGYPHLTMWLIASRLAEAFPVAVARFQRPLVMLRANPYEVDAGRSALDSVQPLGRTAKARYRGLTVMLMGERTQSQAESTGLHLKAANGTTFIGSATTGANGDLTSLVVPGGIVVRFSGAAVSHPDGGQLQRIGLLPDVEVRPTIEGLRSGRDEVLEAALAFIDAS